ncbi:MAG: hypothetical protein ABGZ23_31240, partial [Fuerstiella sp.]
MSDNVSTDELRTDNPGGSPFDTFEVPTTQIVLEPLEPVVTAPVATTTEEVAGPEPVVVVEPVVVAESVVAA